MSRPFTHMLAGTVLAEGLLLYSHVPRTVMQPDNLAQFVFNPSASTGPIVAFALKLLSGTFLGSLLPGLDAIRQFSFNTSRRGLWHWPWLYVVGFMAALLVVPSPFFCALFAGGFLHVCIDMFSQGGVPFFRPGGKRVGMSFQRVGRSELVGELLLVVCIFVLWRAWA